MIHCQIYEKLERCVPMLVYNKTSVITVDKNLAYPMAIADLKKEKKMPVCRHPNKKDKIFK